MSDYEKTSDGDLKYILGLGRYCNDGDILKNVVLEIRALRARVEELEREAEEDFQSYCRLERRCRELEAKDVADE